MPDYAHQTIDLYKSITNVSNLKHAASPFIPHGSVSIDDEEAKGELAPNACTMAWQIIKTRYNQTNQRPCNKSAVLVQGGWWKIVKAHTVYQLDTQLRLVGTIEGDPEHLELRLYVDADFAGGRLTGKSTSGGFLVLHGPNTFFPLAWVSKRQKWRTLCIKKVSPLLQLWDILLGRAVTLRVLEDNQATISSYVRGIPLSCVT